MLGAVLEFVSKVLDVLMDAPVSNNSRSRKGK